MCSTETLGCAFYLHIVTDEKCLNYKSCNDLFPFHCWCQGLSHQTFDWWAASKEAESICACTSQQNAQSPLLHYACNCSCYDVMEASCWQHTLNIKCVFVSNTSRISTLSLFQLTNNQNYCTNVCFATRFHRVFNQKSTLKSLLVLTEPCHSLKLRKQ